MDFLYVIVLLLERHRQLPQWFADSIYCNYVRIFIYDSVEDSYEEQEFWID